MSVSFDVDVVLARLISRIAARAAALTGRDKLTIEMDLTAVHCNGCQLDLERMAEGRDIDLSHDVCGIAQHLDRETGELRDCFLPRFAMISATPLVESD